MDYEHEAWHICFEIQEHISAAEELSMKLYEKGYKDSVNLYRRLSRDLDMLNSIWIWTDEPFKGPETLESLMEPLFD